MRIGIEPCTYGSTADTQLKQGIARLFDALSAQLYHAGITAELLPQPHRNGILKMRPPGLDDAVEFHRFPSQYTGQHDHGRKKTVLDFRVRRDMHRNVNSVIRRLAHIDMIVGMHQVILAELSAENLRSPIGQDLVDIHIL